MNLNLKAKAQHTYDAIVIGSGISGGWAAKELTEKGLQTLVLERGRNVEHVKDYPTATLSPWELPHRGRLPKEVRDQNPVASRCYAYNETTAHFFADESEHPYTQEKPYDWIRAYQVGGKSLLWARMVQRWSDLDFAANAQDGVGTDWPIRYADLAPWYSYVEKFVGISGNRDGLAQVPDGEFLPPFEMNCIEQHMKERIETLYPGRNLIVNRTANLTQAQRIHQSVGRTNCQARDMCARGCPFGAYFSSNSATLPAAQATGRLTLKPDSVVHSIIYDEQQGRATGVRVVDAHTKEMKEYYARIIFVNANTLNTARLLLHSTSSRFPTGLGNDSGTLGHYLIGHNYRGRVAGEYEGFKDKYYYGRRPTSTYVPRFRNFGQDKQTDYIRGYSYSGFGSRSRGNQEPGGPAFGAAFKESLTQPGPWRFGLNGMGEFLPRFENHAALNLDQVDAWGVPTLKISCDYGPNEEAMLQDIMATAAEMIEGAGLKVISITDTKQAPGNENHEMGTARMGKDPKTSVLNKWNQLHAVPNVFVTDGACMASSACQNPSLTYMALTARACDHAVQELKRMNL